MFLEDAPIAFVFCDSVETELVVFRALRIANSDVPSSVREVALRETYKPPVAALSCVGGQPPLSVFNPRWKGIVSLRGDKRLLALVSFGIPEFGTRGTQDGRAREGASRRKSGKKGRIDLTRIR